ncbi:PIR protein, putative [Plasmodium sp.]|nr:PIR protein, putative [Plasmodium sp.]
MKELMKRYNERTALEKVTDTDDLFKGKNEKKVATKGKKGRKKNKKTLGQTLSEWNILPNIDMYEWIPFSSKEAKVDYGKDAIDMDNLFSSIMSSSNALYQKYIDKDDTSNGSSFKKTKWFSLFCSLCVMGDF